MLTVKRSWEYEEKRKWRCQMKTWRKTPAKRSEWRTLVGL